MLEFDRDQRNVAADRNALYYGAEVSERTLVPDLVARLGSTRLDWWIEHVPAPPKIAPAAPTPVPAH